MILPAIQIQFCKKKHLSSAVSMSIGESIDFQPATPTLPHPLPHPPPLDDITYTSYTTLVFPLLFVQYFFYKANDRSALN
jgi:hypothetical protein